MLDTQNPYLKISRYYASIISAHEVGDRQIPWPASIAYLLSSRPVRETAEKRQMMSEEKHMRLFSGLCMCTCGCIHMCVHSHTHMHTH